MIFISSTLSITERLRERAHDTDEGVRQEVVSAVVTAAKRDISKITNDMLTVIKERTLDKKVQVIAFDIFLHRFLPKLYLYPERKCTMCKLVVNLKC